MNIYKKIDAGVLILQGFDFSVVQCCCYQPGSVALFTFFSPLGKSEVYDFDGCMTNCTENRFHRRVLCGPLCSTCSKKSRCKRNTKYTKNHNVHKGSNLKNAFLIHPF
jgi:hypothetical protein